MKNILEELNAKSLEERYERQCQARRVKAEQIRCERMEKTFLRGYPSTRTRTPACFENIPCKWGEMEDKAPETKKPHICRARRLRDNLSIIKAISSPKKQEEICIRKDIKKDHQMKAIAEFLSSSIKKLKAPLKLFEVCMSLEPLKHKSNKLFFIKIFP